jgi:hypothetical protein
MFQNVLGPIAAVSEYGFRADMNVTRRVNSNCISARGLLGRESLAEGAVGLEGIASCF